MKPRLPLLFAGKQSSRPRRRWVTPRVEVLEDRTVLATFLVTSLADAGTGSLREAIGQANATVAADTIVFAGTAVGGAVGLTTFTNLMASTADVPQPAGPSAFIITSPITIQGTGEALIRNGATAFRLFQVTAAGNLTLANLTLSNGLAQGGAGYNGGGAAGLGGAVYNQGTLRIVGVTLRENQAVGGADSGGRVGGGGLGGPGGFMGGGTPNASTDGHGDGGFGGGGTYGGGIGYNGGFGGGGGFGYGAGGFGGFGGGGGGKSIGDADDHVGPGGFGGGDGSGSYGGGGAGMGGAVFNQGGTVTLANSTITGNTAQGGSTTNGGQPGGGFGGGLFNLNGSVTLTNVTFASNIVADGNDGFNHNAAHVYNLSLNVGAVTATQTATVTVANSAFATGIGTAGSEVLNFQVDGTATINATGPNVSTTPVVGFGTVSGPAFTVADPNLGPLQYNGGFTFTMAPNADSPLIDAGSNAAASAAGLTTDQRGFGPRTANGTADIGAFEVGATGPATPATPGARALASYLVLAKNKRTKRSRLKIVVRDADTGQIRAQFNSPFNKPAYKKIAVTAIDTNSDGVTDSVLIEAVKVGLRKRAVQRVFQV